MEERVVEVGERELPLELGLELKREEREGERVRSFGCLTGDLDLSLRMKEERAEWCVVSFGGDDDGKKGGSGGGSLSGSGIWW